MNTRDLWRECVQEATIGGACNFQSAAVDFAAKTHSTLLTALEVSEAENARLRGAFSNLLEMVEQHADFANGVTDPTGAIDEGRVIAAEQLRKFQEVLK